MGLSMGFVVKVTPSNNNPSILGNFFLDCVSELQGCPKLLRTDPGKENVVMATMQCLLRANGNDEFTGEKAHRYGPSTGNQRVECWWSQKNLVQHGGLICLKTW